VAISRARGVGTAVHGTGVVEGADGTNRADGGAPRGDVSEAPAVFALRVPIGRVGALNHSRAGEEAYGGAHCWDVPGVDRDDNGGSGLAFPEVSVRVEVSGGEDAYVFGVEDRLRTTGEEFVRIFGEEDDGEGVDGELGFVGGEAEGQPGSFAYREILVELSGESVEVGCEGGSGGGRVRDEKGDGSAVVDLGRDREG